MSSCKRPRKSKKITPSDQVESDGPLSDTSIEKKPRGTFLHAWPRSDKDGTPLGVDVQKEAGRIRALAFRYFDRGSTRAWVQSRIGCGHRGRELDREDFAQEVLLAIWRRNHFNNPYDPRRGCLSTYVFAAAFSVLSHLTEQVDESRLLLAGDGDDTEGADWDRFSTEHMTLADLACQSTGKRTSKSTSLADSR